MLDAKLTRQMNAILDKLMRGYSMNVLLVMFSGCHADAWAEAQIRFDYEDL
jgi:hypothetical protein